MHTTDHAAAIRQTLKTFGITSRQVSVKTDVYSMGSSIRVSIKDPAISSQLVTMVAEGHESISRDQFGEILSGGNRFVFVGYSHEAAKALAAPYIAAVEAAVAQVVDNTLIPVAGLADCLVGRHGHITTLWGKDGHIGEFYNVEDVAQKIGAIIANGGR